MDDSDETEYEYEFNMFELNNSKKESNEIEIINSICI